MCVGDDYLKCAWVSNNQSIEREREREREKEKEREREREWLVVYLSLLSISKYMS